MTSSARRPGRRSSAATSATPANTPWGWPLTAPFNGSELTDGRTERAAPKTATWSSRRGGPRQEAQEQGKGNEGIFCGAAIELDDGSIVTGSNSPLMHAASARSSIPSNSSPGCHPKSTCWLPV